MGFSKAATNRRPLTLDDGIGLAEALLRLGGFRVLEVVEGPAEPVVTIETVASFVAAGTAECGPRPRTGCRSSSAI